MCEAIEARQACVSPTPGPDRNRADFGRVSHEIETRIGRVVNWNDGSASAGVFDQKGSKTTAWISYRWVDL